MILQRETTGLIKFRLRARLLWALLAFVGLNLYAQEGLWDVDFRTVFDNREGDTKYAAAKTFFLTQLSGSVGLSLLDGQHTIMGGATWTQPVGNDWKDASLSPILFYRYKKDGLTGFLGMFPRDGLYRPVPDYIWNDSTYYVQHTIRGAGIVNVGSHGYIQAFIDWRGMQSAERREAFNVVAMGEWRKASDSFWSLGGVAMMNHLACQDPAPQGQSVVDNFLINPYIGFDFSRMTPSLNYLTLNVGALGALTRDRALDNKWKTPFGLWVDGRVRWKWLAAREEIYAGGALFPYYNEYGFLLDQGEPYFSAKFYSRTELQGYLLEKSFMSLRASLDFHYAGKELMFYQRLILNVNFDGSFRRKSSRN